MVQKIKIIIYYLFISRLPNSRLLKAANKIRVWYVCHILKIMTSDSDNYFENRVYIGSGNLLTIGKCCHINENVFIQGAGIGNYVMIAPHVTILSRSHKKDRLDIPMIKQGETEDEPPIIEDDVWIGRNAIVMPGVRIGSGSIVAAGAVVVQNVGKKQIVGGVPAKLIRNRV